MISCTNRNIMFISLLITLGIYISIQIFSQLSIPVIQNEQSEIEQSSNVKQNTKEVSLTANITSSQGQANTLINNTIMKQTPMSPNSTFSWKICIPKIGLEAPIQNGTNQAIMDKYVGHFEDTAVWNGNIGLAAHNRGYPVNYFKDIKNLQKGDSIQYKTEKGTKEYQVTVVTVIKDTDWSYLKPTTDNRITLITCVENQPEYRRCIQGVEKIK